MGGVFRMIQKISASVFSTVGNRRNINQDNYYLNGKIIDDPNAIVIHDSVSIANGIFAVCDGMGGESDGEIASRIIVDEFMELDIDRVDSKSVSQVIDIANSNICAHITQSGENCGSTFVAALIRGKKAEIYNIGDSRCYLIRDNNILQLSKDHTLVAEMVSSGRITEENAKKDPHRHQLTQHLGIFPEEMSLSIYHKTIELQKDDIILLCSDGVTDGLDNQKISEIVNNHDNIDSLTTSIADQAMRNGSTDNITAMVLHYSEDHKNTIIRFLYTMLCISAGIAGILAAIITLLLL